VAGCERLKKIETRLDTLDSQIATLNEEIKAYDEANKQRFDGHEAAIRQLDDKLTEEIKAYAATNEKRSDAHETTIRQTEDKLTSQIAAQRKAFEQENANLRKSLDATKAKLAQLRRDTKDSDSITKLALERIETASKGDVNELREYVKRRYDDTAEVLNEITINSAEAVQNSTEVRVGMQRLIQAHASYFNVNAKLIKSLEADVTKGISNESKKMLLYILSEQQKAKEKLLNEMQKFLPDVSPLDNAPNNVE
jgi:hypothetical protein